MRFWIGSVATLLMALTIGHAQTYSIFDLSVGSPFDETLAYGISQNGQVVGAGTVPVTEDLHAFIYSNGVYQDLGMFGYPYGADGDAVNNTGQVAATGYGPGYNALIYSNGHATRLGSLDGGYTEGLAINNSGHIVGRAMTGDGGYTGFSYIGGHFAGMTGTYRATGINDSDQIVGSIGYSWIQYGYEHSVLHAFLYSGGAFSDLGSVGGGARTDTEALGINNSGQVVGYSTAADGTIHGFLYSAGVMQDIGTIAPYYAYPSSINNSGLIVGNLQTYVGGPVGGFVYSGGVMQILTDLLDSSGSGWSGLTISGVDDSGRIVGSGTINGETHSFLAAPARPLPVSGMVNLQNYAASAVAGTQVTIELRLVGTITPLDSQVVTLDSSGHFSFMTTLPPGSYDVAAKPAHWLRRTLQSQTLGISGMNGLSFTVVNGDVNGDNTISLTDFGALRTAFGSTSGSGNWNPGADLNGDGTVSLVDFGILRTNFGLHGDL